MKRWLRGGRQCRPTLMKGCKCGAEAGRRNLENCWMNGDAPLRGALKWGKRLGLSWERPRWVLLPPSPLLLPPARAWGCRAACVRVCRPSRRQHAVRPAQRQLPRQRGQLLHARLHHARQIDIALRVGGVAGGGAANSCQARAARQASPRAHPLPCTRRPLSRASHAPARGAAGAPPRPRAGGRPL